MLAPLGSACNRMVITSPLKDLDFRRVAALMKKGRVGSLMIQSYVEFPDLAFLHNFPFLKSFYLSCYGIRSFQGIEALPPDLGDLHLDPTRRTFSLSFLERLQCLTRLSLDSQQKDFEAVSSLRGLRDLTLRSISLGDLSLLIPLRKLLALDIKLGGTRDLTHLPEIGRLKYLELWRIRGLSDLRPIGGVTSLRSLFLENLKHVAHLPPLKDLKVLKRIDLWSMKGLHDLKPLLEAPALEELSVLGATNLEPSDFRFLRTHRTLKRASITMDSFRRNAEVETLLGFPPVKECKPGAAALGV